MPQTHPPAAEAEVDFHDLWVILAGIKTKTALFTMRLSYSGRSVHRASLSQGQEAFLEAPRACVRAARRRPVEAVA